MAAVYYRRTAKVLLSLLCVAGFIYQMSYIYTQFSNKETTTGLQVE